MQDVFRLNGMSETMDASFIFDEMMGDGVTLSQSLTSYDKIVFMTYVDLEEIKHD